jgi:hypothetical protein
MIFSEMNKKILFGHMIVFSGENKKNFDHNEIFNVVMQKSTLLLKKGTFENLGGRGHVPPVPPSYATG